MKMVEVTNVHDYLEYLSNREMDTGRWGFRGVLSPEFDLIPSIGRPSVRAEYDAGLEQYIFQRFRQMAVTFVEPKPDSLVGWLTLARHHGLPTRLLDWTLSPLVALYFAVSPSNRKSKEDYAVYAYESNYYEDIGVVENPFDIKKDFVEVHTDYYSERMAAQRSFGTLHRVPNRPLRTESLIKFVFTGEDRDRDRDLYTLDFYGVNRSSLFPGPDGIAEYWGWFYKISDPSE